MTLNTSHSIFIVFTSIFFIINVFTPSSGFTLHYVVLVTDILSLKADAFKGFLNRKCALLINFLES